MAVKDVTNPLVHKVEMNQGNETRKAKTRLDEIFDEREERAAKRYSAAEMEKMAIEAENETARLRGEPPKHKYRGGEEMDDEEKKKQEEKQVEQRQKLIGHAKTLIDSGMEPQQVGQMLMGLTPSGIAPVVSQGMGFDDVMKIVGLIVGKRETDELKGIIATMDKKIDDLAKGGRDKVESTKPVDPITFARQQAEAVAAWHKAINELIPKPSSAAAQGEPLEVVREKHRHEERMVEVNSEREYKQTLGAVASEIPERIGHGAASRMMESNEGSDDNGGGLEYLTCTEKDCGFRIPITPGTGPQVECPKCGGIYQRKTKVETQ